MAKVVTMDFSVIIPTHCRQAHLERCLRSLARQSADAPTFEVVVVYDGPDAQGQRRTERLGEELGLALAVEAQASSGPAAARNRGAARARGTRVLFIGDDVLADARLMAEHARVAASEGEVAVLGFVPWAESARPTPFMRFLAPERGPQFRFAEIENPRDCGYEFCYTANFAVPRAWWVAEPFDEDFPNAACEDLEWAWRMERRLGARIVFAPQAVASHDHHVTLRGFLRRQRVTGRSAAIVWRKHPELRDVQKAFPPREMYYRSPSGRGWRDRARQLRILTRHYLGRFVADWEYSWLTTHAYLHALDEALKAQGTKAQRHRGTE